MKKVLEAAKGERIKFICITCVSEQPGIKEAETMPFNAAQIAELHAGGVDMTASQIHEEVKRIDTILRGRR